MVGAALPPLIAIVGPTAVGKSSVAVWLAALIGGEIICADSRSQYRYMDIGTAKPSVSERGGIPHHLLDIIDPEQTFSLAQFQALAYDTIADVTRRGRVPLLAGGTGLYVKAVLEGFTIPHIEPDPALRRSLEEQAAAGGTESLYTELQRVDPIAAGRITPANTRRIIRALEVYRSTGTPISRLQTKAPPPYRCLTIGLTRGAASLDAAIVHRVDGMLEAGLVQEVQRLVERGYSYDLPAMSGIGYREVGMYARGEVTLAEARDLIIRNTRRFVRRQYQWFRLNDPAILWFDLDQPGALEAIAGVVGAFGLAAARP